MKKSVKIFAPATVANVGPGFDVLGLCLEAPGDILEVRLNDTGELKIINEATGINLPTQPEKNCASVSISVMLNRLKSKQGFDLIFKEKIKPGSGVGSSAASAAGAVYGANLLLGEPFTRKELVEFAMYGEQAIDGALHADNVAPCLLGNFILISNNIPLRIVEIPAPADLHITVVHPQIELRTEVSRAVIKKHVAFSDAVKQAGNLAGMIAGLYTNDLNLIGNSMKDHLVEPHRSVLIPGFQKAKEYAVECGAIGCSISGAGPSVFAFSKSPAEAKKIAVKWSDLYHKLEIDAKVFVSKVDRQGVREI
ncbi:MAG: homoserine kinase [Sphingobacteriales bacterium]|jgi:homoserine kinase